MPTGKLVLDGKRLKVQFTQDGAERTLQASLFDLLPPLKNLPVERLDGREVEFEVSGTSAKKIGAVKPATPAPSVVAPAHAPAPTPAANRPKSDFVNPYNFVPAVPRDKVTGPLADGKAVGHDRFHDGHFTGVIRVTLKTETPLLIPDAARGEENGDGHKTFPVRVGPDGKPYLAPTAVKGMLRAAYEAVTNSRLGVFPGSLPTNQRDATGNGARLAMRMPAEDGLALVPARIQNGTITLLMGTTKGFPVWNPHNRRWQVPGSLQYGAWLQRYLGAPLCYREDGQRPQHGDTVHCWIQKVQHWRFNRNTGRYVPDFQFWGVREIARDPRGLKRLSAVLASPPVNPGPTDPAPPGKSWYQPLSEAIEIQGWVNVSNQNIKGKHDERVFFGVGSQAISQPLTPGLASAWSELIRDYQAIHTKDLEQREKHKPKQAAWDYLGDQPGKTAWSRHVYTTGCDRLSDGALCYAFVDPTTQGVQALYPVMISRKLFPASPLESLHPSLHPASKLEELSPADRVFGWAHQKGKGAHRGQLRVGPVAMTDGPEGGWHREFEAQGLPLAILGQPKPQQVRFYLGDATGRAQQPGLTKEAAGYDGRKRLRGRKVYPHHRVLPGDHWTPPGGGPQAASAVGTFREYLRPDGTPDSQNRSVRGWVNPGTTFAFDLHVTNLSPVELGALVWLLTLDKDHFHRLGLGKPLGFGSVRLGIAPGGENGVHDAAGWKQFYRTLDIASPVATDLEAAKSEFERELKRAYPADAERILDSCKVAAAGVPNLPVHYPRDRWTNQPGPVGPNPRGEAYEWFVANDANGQLALPELTDGDPGLPILVRRRR